MSFSLGSFKRSRILACGLAYCLASGLVYAKAPKGRYTIANGEVTDNKTGLIWRQTVNPNPFNFADAIAHCSGLGNGYRTPNIRELASLVDELGGGFPVIDEEAFPDTPRQNMWSSTPEAADAAYGWTVNFSLGGVGRVTKTTTLQVRCVR